MKTIALANQKGGVGKTTTAASLGIGLSRQGKKVLLIDADAQGNLTQMLGWPQPDELSPTLSTLMEKIIAEQPITPGEGVLHHPSGVHLVPANIELSALEVTLVNTMSRETVLRQYLSTVADRYDYALIDCMPSLGMLTINALTAADSVIIPVQAQYLPAKGLEQLLRTITRVKRQLNPKLEVDGIVLTMVDSRTTLAREINALVRKTYEERHFDAQPSFLRQCKMFITQDEIDQHFLNEGTESRLTIYSHFCYSHTSEEHQKFIKSCFGEYSGGGRAGYQHTRTGKGLDYERDYNFKKYDTVHLTIPNVVKEYERLIAQKRFPGEDAIAKIPEYERGQLARTVYNGFYNAPDDVPRPYPKGADYYDALPMIEEQLQDKGKTAEMLAALTSRLDGADESDRSYDSVRRAKDRLSEYVDGTFSLFNHRHDTQLVKAVEQNTAVQTAPDTAAPQQGESVTGTMKPDELSTPAALTDEEFAAQNLVPGETLFEIDGRSFLVDRVDTAHGVVNFQDITFVQKVGFPIFRTEPISFVRKIVEQAAPAALAPPQPQTDEPPAAFTPPKKKKQSALAYPLDAGGSNYRITDDHIGEGAPLERFQRNLDAIRTLKAVEAENRIATAEEQSVLAQYVGWGGLADFFDEKNSRYAELKELLTDAEYAAARESTLTAFYTPPVVIRGIYAALGQMGFTQGNILEPACGIGNFLGMLPESMSGSKLYGVELDDLSGRIARQLYQQSSIAVQGYEKTAFPDNFFDIAIGNVPFGQFHVADKRYDRLNFPIHEYFVAKALDQVRPGGVIAVVTSSYTMDKRTASARKYIAQRAELLGAIRLPNNAFKAAAGTEVVSDILFLQKRERMVDIEPEWVHLATNEDGIQMNSYFIDHPDMILGEMKMVSGPFGPTPTCEPYPDQSLEELLAEAVQNIHGEITAYDREEELEGEDHSIEADPAVRNFSYTLVAGQIYYRENSRMNPVEVSKTAESRIRGMIELRDCVRTLLEYQTEDYPDEEIKAQQAKLNTLYDAFTRKYGLINSRGNAIAFDQDSSYFLLCSLEILDEDRNLKRKADLFTKRTIRSHKPAEKVDTAVEALALSIGEKAHVDMDYMGRLTGKDEETLFSELTGVVFLNPDYNEGVNEKYLPADEYLSGNVRQKWAVAKAKAEQDAQYQVNADALAQVQPVDLTASEISVRLGATWLDTEYVRQFIFDPNLSDADVSLVPKSVNENGRTLTLADVSWQEAAVDPTDGYDIPIRYTAVASYTGTATSKYATGYTVTADYKGDITRTSCDTVVYTAVFSSVGAAASAKSGVDFNWLWLLIPVGAAALGGCGYAGYKGYRHYINKKRGYAA